MKAVDTNILVYAHREEMPLHEGANTLLTRLAEGTAPWGLPIFCIGEFVRVVTHRRIFHPPSSLDRALAFIKALAESPTLLLLSPGADYSEVFCSMNQRANAAGNLAFDTQIAAVCHSHGATLITADRDFARFDIDTQTLV